MTMTVMMMLQIATEAEAVKRRVSAGFVLISKCFNVYCQTKKKTSIPPKDRRSREAFLMSSISTDVLISRPPSPLMLSSPRVPILVVYMTFSTSDQLCSDWRPLVNVLLYFHHACGDSSRSADRLTSLRAGKRLRAPPLRPPTTDL